MASSEGDGHITLDKFGGDNFNLYKFKLEMVMSTKDLWEIVEGTELPPPSTASDEVKKAYERRCKKAFAIIATSLVDKELAHIKGCKGPAEAWKTLCNIHETKSLSNILFIRRKFFTIKMDEGADILDHINKVKSLADQLTCLEVPMKDEDVVMTLLDSLPPSFDHLITALETRPISELTLDFITARLMHEVSKRKEKEPQGDDAAMLSRQPRTFDNNERRGDGPRCYNCGKLGHLARNCRLKRKVNANIARSSDDFAFVVRDGASKTSTTRWIVDSGASNHMTPHKQFFDTYESISGRKVFMGDNGIVEVLGKGSILVETRVKGRARSIRMHDVLHVPDLHSNLLSVSKLISRGLKVHFNSLGCVVRASNGEMLAVASLESNLYQLDTKVMHEAETSSLAHSEANSHPLELWHKRLGHLNANSVKSLQTMVSGMDVQAVPNDVHSFACEGCVQGKQARRPFPTEGGTRATKILELVHSDVCGPMKTPSIGGARYFLTFIDDFSRKIWVYVLKSKSEVLARFKEWKTLVERQSEHVVKVLRTDNGGEYISKAFDDFLSKHGIARQNSSPYTPQQNGVAERANRTIVEMARSMIHAQRLGHEFWAEAVCNAVYVRNRCPTKAVEGKTPEEAWSGRMPHVSHMRVFGCVAYAKVPDQRRTKLDAKGVKCLFLGYCEGTKAYRLICLETKKIIKSPDVVFFEDKTHLEDCPSGSIDETPAVKVDISAKSDVDESEAKGDDPLEAHEEPDMEEEEDAEANIPATKSTRSAEASKLDYGKKPATKAPPPPQHSNETMGHSRYPDRARKPLGEWWKNHIPPPQDKEHANMATIGEPRNVREAIESSDASEWELAMQEEFESLIANGTWELTPLPKGRKAVKCKWVFKTKKDARGVVVRFKARLVAKGCSQVEGVDFSETFAPVAKFNTIRVILALAAAMGLEIHQMDVKTAFLNGELDVVIYMEQPEGFVQKGREHLVCKLRKTLYGLKQSGRAWYECIHVFFVNRGFTRSHADHSLYILQTYQYIVIVIIYVDDLIILASDVDMINELKASLEREFEMSDLGELHFFLGVHFERDRRSRTITMHQRSYIETILERFGMADCKPIATPLDAKTPLPKLSDEEHEEHLHEMKDVPYQEAVGSLMYAMVATRPDLAFAVSVVSRYMSKPGPMHWMAVKRIMRYLKGTLDMKLRIGGNHINVKGYSDADWAGDVENRRSTSGYVFFVGEGAVSWNSKRQQTVAQSTMEAEYMAMNRCTREAIWLRQLMEDVGCVQEEATTIMCDNQGSMALAKNPTNHDRSKHIDVQHHFIREKIENKIVELEYCPTQYMVADILTKALARDRHEGLSEIMGLENNATSQSGSIGR